MIEGFTGQPSPGPELMRVAVTGAAGAVGSRVVTRLASEPDVEVLGVDRVRIPATVGVESACVDLVSADLATVLAGVHSVVHLAGAVRPSEMDEAADELEMAILRRVLAGAAAVGAGRFAMLSTAMVYGARAGNPVPLSEDAPVHPNPDFGWAVLRAAMERAVLEWRTNHDATAAILRPTAVVTDDDLGSLAKVLHTARVGIAADGDPPVQYLHVDDLASAVVCVVLAGFDGVANVAPDGWIPPETLNDLEGPRPRVRVPSWAARAIAALRSRAGVAPVPPGIISYASHSWVVANDRIRGLGWCAEHTNEQAWVMSHGPGPLDRIPAGRRQQLALGALATAVATALGAVAATLVRHRRRAVGSAGRLR